MAQRNLAQGAATECVVLLNFGELAVRFHILQINRRENGLLVLHLVGVGNDEGFGVCPHNHGGARLEESPETSNRVEGADCGGHLESERAIAPSRNLAL